MRTPHAYDYALKLNKKLSYALTGMIAVSLSLALAISMMIPLKTTVHTVYEITPAGTHLVKIHPVGLNFQSKDALTKAHLMRWIVARQEFFPARVEDNARLINHFSTAVEMGSFAAMVENHFVGRTTIRSVEVLSFTKLTSKSFQVIYETIDHHKEGPEGRKFSAIIGYKFDDRQIYETDLVFNPYGLLVSSFYFSPLKGSVLAATMGDEKKGKTNESAK